MLLKYHFSRMDIVAETLFFFSLMLIARLSRSQTNLKCWGKKTLLEAEIKEQGAKLSD